MTDTFVMIVTASYGRGFMNKTGSISPKQPAFMTVHDSHDDSEIILRLHDNEHLSIRDISKRIGWSRDRVHRVIKRARRREEQSIERPMTIEYAGVKYTLVEDRDLINHYYVGTSWGPGDHVVKVIDRNGKAYILSSQVHKKTESVPDRCPACKAFSGPGRYWTPNPIGKYLT
jgi:predicted DNA-binding protein (UPF0251 family)